MVSGDHPDPSILRDGTNYYLAFSSFDAYPGLPLWGSTDMVAGEAAFSGCSPPTLTRPGPTPPPGPPGRDNHRSVRGVVGRNATALHTAGCP